MEATYPQRAPAPGRTWVRLNDRTWELQDAHWEEWVRRGWIPPDALVLSAHWTRSVWRRAGTLEVYHLFRPSESAHALAGGGTAGTNALEVGTGSGSPLESTRARGLPSAIWGPGLSVTQVLVLINLLVSAALVWAWKDTFTEHLWAFSGRLHDRLVQGWVPVLVIPLFLHASAGHLLGNMLGLTAAGAAVEEFYGKWKTLLFYGIAGLCGACLSILRVKPLLSVGASGAIMGLYGIILAFLLRYRGRFSERQRWKTTRVYFPLLVLALLPSLFMADVYSHVGGFVGGFLIGLVVPPDEERLPRPRTRLPQGENP